VKDDVMMLIWAFENVQAKKGNAKLAPSVGKRKLFGSSKSQNPRK
jgi:hypothetical protein